MYIELSERGFRFLKKRNYSVRPQETRVVSESSAIGPYDDSMENPGSSYLWVGNDHHLNREESRTLALAILHWTIHGKLPDDSELQRFLQLSEEPESTTELITKALTE